MNEFLTNFNGFSETVLFNNMLDQKLYGFNSHNLATVGNLELMQRVDTKFLIKQEDVEALLDALEESYSVLNVNDEKICEYKNIYFDTSDFYTYHTHHNKILSRYKIRQREYLSSGTRFMEFKEKSNKLITMKKRIQLFEESTLHSKNVVSFLKHAHPDILKRAFQPKIEITYKRISLMSRTHKERISIDLEVSADSLLNNNQFSLNEYAIVEIKQSRINRHSPAYKVMKDLNYRSLSISKYCLSSTIVNFNNIKTNRFKPLINNLNYSFNIRAVNELTF